MNRLEMFYQHVDKAGPIVRHGLGPCWMWCSSRTRRGYGSVTLFNRNMGAHRASWILENGFLPPSLKVCHHCDNPPCVRPDHLFVGTMQDNMDDKCTKGRHDCGVGERNGNARLDDEAVLLIRRQVSEGLSYKRIAKAIGLHHTTVSRAARALSWRHIKGE